MLVIETTLRSPAGEALTTGLLAIATTKVLLMLGDLLVDMVRALHFSTLAFSTRVRRGDPLGGAAPICLGTLARL